MDNRPTPCLNRDRLSYKKIKDSNIDGLQQKVTNAITTNETSFFRDGHPFQAFQKIILNDLISHYLSSFSIPLHKIKIWSAAASTGEEAYSLAMLIHEHLKFNNKENLTPGHFEILATDISTEVLKQAEFGRFSSFKVKRGLTQEMRERYFETDDKYWNVKPSLRQMIKFQHFNLLNSYQSLGSFNLIFCRNVLIYFQQDIREKIFKELHKVLAPNGLLILGSTENMYGIENDFSKEIIDNTLVYRKK